MTVLLPLYDVATGTGSSGKYYIKGFAAFHVKAGASTATSSATFHNKLDFSRGTGIENNAPISGYFVRYVSLDGAYTLGTPRTSAPTSSDSRNSTHIVHRPLTIRSS